MTLYQFNALNQVDQHEAVWYQGAHVGERSEGEYKVVLYQLCSFYVELYYHPKLNAIHRLKCFSNTECLDTYISDINLKSLDKH